MFYNAKRQHGYNNLSPVKFRRHYFSRLESAWYRPGNSILQYMNWYKRERPHSSLAKKTPDEANAVMLPTVKQAA